MAENIEIKAKVENISLLEARVADICEEGSEVINQKDTFFQCNNGRLKLREFSPN